MIRPLRQRHRRMMIALAVLVPVTFVVAIAARKPFPESASISSILAPAPQALSASIWDRDGLFADVPIHSRLLREFPGAGRFAIALSAGPNFLKPDLLVYLASSAPKAGAALPGDAKLLGAFNATLPLPDRAEGQSLVLYSLADHEVIAVSSPINLK
jgi:hypothetical protein